MGKEKGITVVFDADYYTREIENNYELIDVFIASEFYYNAVFKDDNYEKNCKTVQEQGPEIVVFTFGERGSWEFAAASILKSRLLRLKLWIQPGPEMSSWCIYLRIAARLGC